MAIVLKGYGDAKDCGCGCLCAGAPNIGYPRVRIHTPPEDGPAVTFNSNATDKDRANYPNSYTDYDIGIGPFAGSGASRANISYYSGYDFCTDRYDVYRQVELISCTTEVYYDPDSGDPIYTENCVSIPWYDPSGDGGLIGTAPGGYTDFALDKDKIKIVGGGEYTSDNAPSLSLVGVKWCSFSYPYSAGSQGYGYIYTSLPFCVPWEDYPTIQIINRDGPSGSIYTYQNSDTLGFRILYGYPNDKDKWIFA